mgnify:CR=1 FL=1
MPYYANYFLNFQLKALTCSANIAKVILGPKHLEQLNSNLAVYIMWFRTIYDISS